MQQARTLNSITSINSMGNLTRVASHPRMESSPVMHFFDLMRLRNSPAGTRWAACFMAAIFR